jgi:hypothetical protein
MMTLMLTEKTQCSHEQSQKLQKDEMENKLRGRKLRWAEKGGRPFGAVIVFSKNRRLLLMRDVKSASRQLMDDGWVRRSERELGGRGGGLRVKDDPGQCGGRCQS